MTEAEVFQQAIKEMFGKLMFDVVSLQTALASVETKALEFEAENTQLRAKLAEYEKNVGTETAGQTP
jgi:hypothetical protein